MFLGGGGRCAWLATRGVCLCVHVFFFLASFNFHPAFHDRTLVCVYIFFFFLPLYSFFSFCSWHARTIQSDPTPVLPSTSRCCFCKFICWTIRLLIFWYLLPYLTRYSFVWCATGRRQRCYWRRWGNTSTRRRRQPFAGLYWRRSLWSESWWGGLQHKSNERGNFMMRSIARSWMQVCVCVCVYIYVNIYRPARFPAHFCGVKMCWFLVVVYGGCAELVCSGGFEQGTIGRSYKNIDLGWTCCCSG